MSIYCYHCERNIDINNIYFINKIHGGFFSCYDHKDVWTHYDKYDRCKYCGMHLYGNRDNVCFFCENIILKMEIVNDILHNTERDRVYYLDLLLCLRQYFSDWRKFKIYDVKYIPPNDNNNYASNVLSWNTRAITQFLI